MHALRERLEASPVMVRVVPFLIFLVLTFVSGSLGEGARYWGYAVKTGVGALLVWLTWPFVREMRWKLSLEAVVAGILVFVIWVGLDGWYPLLPGGGEAKVWNPHVAFGESTALAWVFIGVRVLGSALVVPPLEEVFYRSFVYRYVVRADFQSVVLGAWSPLAFLVASALFAVEHREWLPGLLCGFIYQGLVCWRGRLGDAMTAHAITNLLLGLWVVWKGAWRFW